jgi:hypothetical protein
MNYYFKTLYLPILLNEYHHMDVSRRRSPSCRRTAVMMRQYNYYREFLLASSQSQFAFRRAGDGIFQTCVLIRMCSRK